jgi:hypothetical protein
MSEELKDVVAPYPTTNVESPYAALANEIYRERVIRAQNTSPEEKLLAGQRLFESACEITLAGIHNENPGIAEEAAHNILRERLAWRRRREREE